MHARPVPLIALALALPAAAVAQPAPPAARPCAPRIEVRGTAPPRVASRLRALADALPAPSDGACQGPTVRFTWTPRRLVVEVALDDGRMASRDLRSLDDALPTLLAVLSAPPEPPAPEPLPPAPETEDPEDPEADVAPPPAAPPARAAPPPRPRRGLRLLVAASAGRTTTVASGVSLWTARAEAGLATPRLRLALRVGYGDGADGHERRRNDRGGGEGERRTQELLVAASVRVDLFSLGPLRVEGGVFGGVAWRWLRVDGARDVERVPRFGLETAASLPLAGALEGFARAEAWVEPRRDVGRPTVAGAMTLGVAWGGRR